MAVVVQEKDYLAHYGILRRSGRYPWGTGGNTEKRSRSFMDYIRELFGRGLTESQIAQGLSTDEVPFTTTDLRAAKTIALNQIKQADIAQATRLKDRGWSNTAIAERMYGSASKESNVRALLAPGAKDKADNLTAISNMLREQVDKKTYIDIGANVEHQINVPRGKLDVAAAMLKEDGGYTIHTFKVPQQTTGKETRMKVLCPPGTTQKEAWLNRDKVQQIVGHSEDSGRTFLGIYPPKSIDSSRVQVKYHEDGGSEADGVMYVRPGVKDVSLGGNNYAQVRVLVNGTHYIKGMAVYKDDLPDGVDIQFNTNKSSTGNDLDALKKINKDDPDNPFGSYIKRQVTETDSKGKTKAASAMNIVNEEGDWGDWSRSLSSQMLSKQSPQLAKEQLEGAYRQRKEQLDEINKLTNPTVRKKLLETYAEDLDKASFELKAKPMPGQASQVILPVNSLKDNEIYAPNFKHGDTVVLVRHPHGGIFEIPTLKVNNNHPESKKLIGPQAKDAVGINSKVAARLSGADFDGDSVLVIPNGSGKIKTADALEGLKGFDPQRAYPKYEGMKVMSAARKQQEMGNISNLITDMTIRGASPDEIARAVRHSMVVIDAEKHELNYRQSAIDNGIVSLKRKYQEGGNKGASTLISRAKSQKFVDERKPRPAEEGGPVDPATGRKVFVKTGRTYTDSKGKVRPRQTQTTKLADTDDAHTLSSGQPIEKIYADHSNLLKGLANSARKSAVHTKSIPYSPSAAKTYAKEVASLDAKLKVALRNSPLERQAQIIAGTHVKAKRQANPNMEKDELKKIQRQALAEARLRMGAKKESVEINWDEWNAIQAGAISPSKLGDILNNSDIDQVKKMALPKQKLLMSSSKKTRATAMLKGGATRAEVAAALGVSLSTLDRSLAGGE